MEENCMKIYLNKKSVGITFIFFISLLTVNVIYFYNEKIKTFFLKNMWNKENIACGYIN